MSIKVDSLKRLYSSGKITDDEISALTTVSPEEKEEILTSHLENGVEEYIVCLQDLGVDITEDLREATEQRAIEIAGFEEKSSDFQTLIDNLPPGQVKNLLKDEVCGEILSKYGVEG